ncbi:MAG: YeeE/YedE family protein [Myxococcales bacterium]|nr:YeeE/YedE family protein [Myxococcales bacterium]
MHTEPGFWIWPLIGGALIGGSAALMMALHGRIAGISGIVSGLITGDRALWRSLFVGGLIVGGLAMYLLQPTSFTLAADRSLGATALAGLLVGLGTRLGNGCTSGHGVCGIARLSPRSIVATITFMATGALTVVVVRSFFGGRI